VHAAAANRGYQAVLASDCTASMRGADQHWMALELMSRSIGWVLTVDEIVDRLGLSGRTGPSWPTPPRRELTCH
jgi:nicotinamidase-related amidase